MRWRERLVSDYVPQELQTMKAWLILGHIMYLTVQVQLQSTQQNVTKRGLQDQISYYTDPASVRYFPVAPSNIHPYANPHQTGEYPKQVAVQQVLYDYPHDTSDHLHAPTQYHNHQQVQAPIVSPVHHPHSAIAAPVQHSAVVHHGQSYSRFVHPYPASPPLAPAPGAHTHVNPPIYTSKIVYHPQRAHIHPTQTAPVVTQKPFRPSPLISTTYNKGKPKQSEEYTRDEDEDHENYEEDDEEFKPYKSSKYSDSDDDEEDGHYRVQEDDDEDRFSRNVRKPRNKKHSSKPKTHYKSFKYTSSNSKPTKDIYESRQTQNIPAIAHRQSFRQENWIVTKQD